MCQKIFRSITSRGRWKNNPKIRHMQMTVFDCRHGEETKRNPREDGKGK